MSGKPVDVATRRAQKRLIDAAWDQIEEVSGFADSTLVSSRARRLVTDRGRPPAPIVDSLPGYQIQGEIHRGGQGIVYRAIQESTGRTVAIKVMLGRPLAGASDKARFDREVQILAQLKHPNIVTVHDSGSAGHASYFVMDYIEGAPLDQYVAAHGLSVRDRLRLFARICEAVNVAHLRGVIHRDLKPGNIRIDSAGAPHVLDFGLAKHAEWEMAGDSGAAVTRTGQFVGSPPWASPEQADGRVDGVDLRTDVYSLGVVLYQLLTGQFPYNVTGSLTEIARNILTCEPKNPRVFDRRLDDEVATIVLKALRKERELRYQTAGALGDDVSRYLAGEPIAAKRDSVTYIIRKQLMRHKIAVSVIASLVLTVTIGFFVSLSFWRQAALALDAEAAQKHIAMQNEALAQRRAERAAAEAAKARAVSAFLTEMLESASPVTGEGPEVTVREVIDAAVHRLEHGSLTGQPELEGAVRHAIGTTYGTLGLYDEALAQLEAARRLLFTALPHHAVDVLTCVNELATVHTARGDLDAAEELFRSTLDAAREHHGPDSTVTAQTMIGLAEVLRDRNDYPAAITLNREAVAILRTRDPIDEMGLTTALNDLALSLQSEGEFDAAFEAQREALDRLEAHYGPDHYATASARSNLAGILASRGEYAEAEAYYERALASFRAVLGEKHPAVASCLGSLGLLLVRQKKLTEGKACLEQALALRRELLGPDHPLVGNSLNNLAIAKYRLGDLDGAAEHYEEALAIYKAARGEDDPSLCAMMTNLAAILRAKGDRDDAVRMLRDVLARRRAHYGEAHPLVATDLNNLGKTLAETGELEEAEVLLREALARRRSLLGDDHPETASTMDNLAGMLREAGRLDEAEALFREALEVRRRRFGDTNLSVAESLNNLAGLLVDRGLVADAEVLYSEAVRLAEHCLPADHWQLAMFRGNWGGALSRLGRYDEAETRLTASYEGLSAARGDSHAQTRQVMRLLVRLYEESDRPDEAEAWRARLASAE